MRSPYNMELIENCAECKLRCDGFFCELPSDVLERFQSLKHATVFPKGSILFVEGQSPRGIMLLCKGRVKLSVCSSGGKTIIVHIAESGEVMGLSAVVAGEPYEVTAETIEPCQVNFIPRDEFLKFLSRESAASLQVARQLSSAYRSMSEQLRCVGLSSSALAKLSHLILGWCERDGKQTPRGISVKLTFTHEEIAQLIGVSRETVTRMFGDLRHRELAILSGATLTVPNIAALEKLLDA